MVHNLAQSDTLRPLLGTKPNAKTKGGLARPRMADGMEPSRPKGLDDSTPQQLKPSWRQGWHTHCRRFIAHQYADGQESEGGDVWRVIDTDALIVIGQCGSQKNATLIADALEFLSLNTDVTEFDAHLCGAKNS